MVTFFQVVSERLFSSMSSSRRSSNASELSNDGSEGEKIHEKEKTGSVEDSSTPHDRPSCTSGTTHAMILLFKLYIAGCSGFLV